MDDRESSGDLGEDSAPNLSDTRMQERAIRERWPIPDAVRVKILNRLCKIVDEDADHGDLPTPNHREVTAASRALFAADKLNIERDRLDLERQRLNKGEGEVPTVRDVISEAEARADAFVPDQPPTSEE